MCLMLVFVLRDNKADVLSFKFLTLSRTKDIRGRQLALWDVLIYVFSPLFSDKTNI